MTKIIRNEFRWIETLVLAGAMSLTPTAVKALEEKRGYDQVSLSTVAEGTVARQVVVATLVARHEGPTLESLTTETNRDVKNALESAKKVAGVKAQTQDYRTIPTYQDQKSSGWLVQQSIQIESRDAEKLGALLGDLQKTLKLESVDYLIAPEARKAVEDRLILEAVKGFQDRAEQITKSLGRNRYRLVKLDIGGEPSPPRSPRPFGRMQSAESTSAPMLETGEAPLTITVQGTIELQPN